MRNSNNFASKYLSSPISKTCNNWKKEKGLVAKKQIINRNELLKVSLKCKQNIEYPSKIYQTIDQYFAFGKTIAYFVSYYFRFFYSYNMVMKTQCKKFFEWKIHGAINIVLPFIRLGIFFSYCSCYSRIINKYKNWCIIFPYSFLAP